MDIDSNNTVPMNKNSQVETVGNYSSNEVKTKSLIKEEKMSPLLLEGEKSVNTDKDSLPDRKKTSKQMPKLKGKPSSTLPSPTMTSKNEVDQNLNSDTNEKKSWIKQEDRKAELENQNSRSSITCVKKLKDKSHSLDSDSAKPVERRRSKIFETAEKFNQMAASVVEAEKPRKIFIPGVNVGGTKRAFERKASLSSNTLPPPSSKLNNSKVNNLIDKKEEKALQIVSGCEENERKNSLENNSKTNSKLNLIIQVGPNDARSATVSVSTPTEVQFPSEGKQDLQPKLVSQFIHLFYFRLNFTIYPDPDPDPSAGAGNYFSKYKIQLDISGQ